MILAFDTYYFENKAKTVGVKFENYTDKFPIAIYSEIIENVEDYVPGEFYRREMPCILHLIKSINMASVKVIIIDGFVVVDDNGKLGLGGHLYESLDRKFPVIGVAKTNFASVVNNKRAVLRGKSMKPLYVTSVGIDLDQAAEFIKDMYGEFRLPDLLKLLDSKTKEKC